MEVLTYILPFIILLTVVVFVHEYGHYYFAKRYGVGVTDFLLVLAKKFLVLQIRMVQDGNSVLFHLVVM